MSDRATPVFIIGYGDLGRRVAVRWLKRGAKVRALVRHPVTIAEPMHPRLERHRGDLDNPATLPVDAMSGTRLYYFAPPPASGIVDTRMRNLTEALRAPPAKTVLVSTTGVYGDCGGDWVGESRPPNPESDRARRRLGAEQLLEGYAKRHEMPLAILRVAGIYGPDRLPEKRLREQAPMPAADDCGYTNRIHIEDLVEICVEVMARPAVTGLFNVSDGSPGTLRQYFDLAADALG
ncbi:MAG: NAD-dependent epimerase/dehydratase family protein, partial [Arenicellales bacterium]